jgi:hypothetical protein
VRIQPTFYRANTNHLSAIIDSDAATFAQITEVADYAANRVSIIPLELHYQRFAAILVSRLMKIEA